MNEPAPPIQAKQSEPIRIVRTLPKHALTAWHALAAIPAMALFAGWLISEAKGHASGVERQVIALDQKVEANRQAAVNAIQLVREENKETRTDIRALSAEIRTGQPTARLAAPVPELKPLPVPEVKP